MKSLLNYCTDKATTLQAVESIEQGDAIYIDDFGREQSLTAAQQAEAIKDLGWLLGILYQPDKDYQIHLLECCIEDGLLLDRVQVQNNTTIVNASGRKIIPMVEPGKKDERFYAIERAVDSFEGKHGYTPLIEELWPLVNDSFDTKRAFAQRHKRYYPR